MLRMKKSNKSLNLKLVDKMNLTPAIIKELREKSGAGMMDCKKALDESDGNVEKAIEWLRKKGINTAQKNHQDQLRWSCNS